MANWCLQCAIEHKAYAAVGLDEDGEPACAVHAKREPAKFDEAFIDSRFQQLREPAPPKRVEPAAVKPAPRQEKTEMFTKKQCIDCGTEFTATGNAAKRCEDCKAASKASAKKTTRKKTAKRAEPANEQPASTPLAALKAKLQRELAAIETVEGLLGFELATDSAGGD